MCGRSSLTKTEKEIEERFNATFYSDELERYNPIPNYNIAPTQYCAVITNMDRDKINLFKWGLIPHWSTDTKSAFRMINARIETLQEKPAFKNLVQSHRCIVPLDGYYEWKKEGKTKQAYRITTKDQAIFSCAGLYTKWKSPTNDTVHSFTIITQNASSSIAHIHERMPAILSKAQESFWLDNNIPPKEVIDIISPYSDEQIHHYPVSNRVGKVSENDEKLIEEIAVQKTLFD